MMIKIEARISEETTAVMILGSLTVFVNGGAIEEIINQTKISFSYLFAITSEAH